MRSRDGLSGQSGRWSKASRMVSPTQISAWPMSARGQLDPALDHVGTIRRRE
jgi:hypothetical protein